MCTTAFVPSRWLLYVAGLRISALTQCTSLDHGGGCGEDVTEDQVGSPERLLIRCKFSRSPRLQSAHLNEITSQPLATAYLHILEPRNPFPPAIIIFFLAVAEAVAAPAAAAIEAGGNAGGLREGVDSVVQCCSG